MNIKVTLFFVVLQCMHYTSAFYAYDCTHDRINVTHVSLSSIKSCAVEESKIQEEQLDVQVLQISDVKSVKVYQCKVNVLRQINVCGGMISYVKSVEGGLSEYMEKIGRDQCIEMHRYKTYAISEDNKIKDLIPNGTVYASVVTTGLLDKDGACRGGIVNHRGTQYRDVIVQSSYTITLNDYYTEALIDDDLIELRSKKGCSYKYGECLDTDHGYSFWNINEDTNCFSNSYTVLYQGPASKTYMISDSTNPVYTVKTDEVLISLTAIRQTLACGLPALQTEHPKLLIVPKLGPSYSFQKHQLTKGNFDMFTYTNTKFVYLERHIQTQMKVMYKEIINDRCVKSREILFTQAAIGINHPDEFARIYMKQEGYTAIMAGEGIHIIQCQPVEVQVRGTSQCYAELPVLYKNMTYFMTPYNRILKTVGTERVCSSQLPSVWKLNGKYYSMTPNLIEAKPPIEMDPSETGSWEYKSPGDLMKGGLIVHSELEAMNRAIMFNFDKQSVSDGIVYRSTEGGSSTTINLTPFMDKQEIADIAQGVLSRTFWWVRVFGEYSAALIGFYFIFRFIKSFLDAIFHGLILYDLWGFSWKLISGFWDALSMYITHLGNMKEKWRKQRYQKPSDRLVDSIDQNNKVEPYEHHKRFREEEDDINIDKPSTPTRLHPDLDEAPNLNEVVIKQNGVTVTRHAPLSFPTPYTVQRQD